MQKSTFKKANIESYVPIELYEYLKGVMNCYHFDLDIVKPRKTKLGDCRIDAKSNRIKITINNDLNPFAFSITLLHELAHLSAFLKFGRFIRPHGREWKSEYKSLIQPLLNSKKLPKDIESALIRSVHAIKASSCADYALTKALNQYDKKNPEVIYLEDVKDGESFIFRSNQYLKISLKRSRYLCTEYKTKKRFLIHRLAQVKKIE